MTSQLLRDLNEAMEKCYQKERELDDIISFAEVLDSDEAKPIYYALKSKRVGIALKIRQEKRNHTKINIKSDIGKYPFDRTFMIEKNKRLLFFPELKYGTWHLNLQYEHHGFDIAGFPFERQVENFNKADRESFIAQVSKIVDEYNSRIPVVPFKVKYLEDLLKEYGDAPVQAVMDPFASIECFTRPKESHIILKSKKLSEAKTLSSLIDDLKDYPEKDIVLEDSKGNIRSVAEVHFYPSEPKFSGEYIFSFQENKGNEYVLSRIIWASYSDNLEAEGFFQ
jgi:hypothetical protein